MVEPPEEVCVLVKSVFIECGRNNKIYVVAKETPTVNINKIATEADEIGVKSNRLSLLFGLFRFIELDLLVDPLERDTILFQDSSFLGF
jgi:hypothetical protein